MRLRLFPGETMKPAFCAELFEQHVGTVFTYVGEGGQESALTLDSVECKPALNTGPFHSFTLFFTSVGKVFFPQGTYPLRHEKLGEQSIFISALAETETSFKYQAPFSVEKQDTVPA